MGFAPFWRENWKLDLTNYILYYTFWLCFYKKGNESIESNSLSKLFTKRGKRANHSLKRAEEWFNLLYIKKTGDPHEKSKNEFPTLELINVPYIPNSLGLASKGPIQFFTNSITKTIQKTGDVRQKTWDRRCDSAGEGQESWYRRHVTGDMRQEMWDRRC